VEEEQVPVVVIPSPLLSSPSSHTQMSSSSSGAAAVPAADLDFPALGITLKGIYAFLAAHGGREAFEGKTTASVCVEVMLPATQQVTASWCTLHADRADEVGPATAFVSHAWGYEFLAVVDALEAWEGKRSSASASAPQTVFWFDLFSNPQHGTSDRPFEWWKGCFRDSIQRIGHTLLVLEWEDPKPLTRAWCVWEMASSVGKHLEVVMSPLQAERFEGALVSEFDSLVKKLCAVDVERAEAFHPSDRDRILTAVKETVGANKVNEMVAGEMREWMAGAGMAALGRVAPEERATSSLLDAVARLFKMEGKLGEAEVLLREAADVRTRVLGPEDPSSVESRFALANVLYLQGKVGESEPLYREVLDFRRRTRGPDDAHTLTSIGNLANVFYSQGKLDEAEPLYRETLEGRRRVLGPDHTEFFDSLNNLANLLDDKPGGSPVEAEALYREALEGYKRVVGRDHPETLDIANNLAGLLKAQGRLEEAELLYGEALEGYRRVLGPDHPNSIFILNNLAGLLKALGKLGEAAPMYREALERGRRILGPDNTNTLIFLTNCAAASKDLGKPGEAEPLYLELLERKARLLGPDHPSLSDAHHALGVVLRRLGRHDEGLVHARRADEERRGRLGDEHEETRKSRLSLARLEGDKEVEEELVGRWGVRE
jgi:tetratricopeptide (TPR) repeat protein